MIKENYVLTLEKRLERIHPARDEDITLVIKACEGSPELHMVRDVIRVIANSGLRNCELVALRCEDIDLDHKWMLVGRGRNAKYARRLLPLRHRTMAALASLQQTNPGCPLVLGRNPLERMRDVVHILKKICPALARRSQTMYPLRMNFVSRLYSSGVPLSVVKYCLGDCDESMLLGHLSLAPEVKREILRRNLESFLPEL